MIVHTFLAKLMALTAFLRRLNKTNYRRCSLRIKVYLHGFLRDYLPAEAKGRTTITLDDGATVGQLLAHLGIKRRVVVALGNDHEPNMAHVLQDGDEVAVYSITSGG